MTKETDTIEMKPQPFVTVLTPVYNGAKYLTECVESVLTQTYPHWEYVIVNNCSTDSTLDIANQFAERDRRVRVVTNAEFVDVIENHNIAFKWISPGSKYCKMVSADDWIYPECIGKMVTCAEANPSVAIVGSYAISAHGLSWAGLPVDRSVFEGREVCRLHLLGGPLVMGEPSSVLYRSDIVRAQNRFFTGPALSADVDACYRTLQKHDYGFVHQILSFKRIHDEALSARQQKRGAFFLDHLAFLVKHGPHFLTQEEYETEYEKLMNIFYQYLATAFVNRYDDAYRQYFKDRLEAAGIPYRRGRVIRAVLGKIMDLLLNPKSTVEKGLRRSGGP